MGKDLELGNLSPMGTFKYSGKEYSIEDLTAPQKRLVYTLRFIKQLTNEKNAKTLILQEFLNSLNRQLEEKLGSEIGEINIGSIENTIVLKDGSEHLIDDLDSVTQREMATLSFVNSEMLDTRNILQALDTAKITYSRDFALTLK